MFNIDKREYFKHLTTGELIKVLKQYTDGTPVSICGGDGCYLHVDEDTEGINGITLDYSALDEEYDDTLEDADE